MDSIEQLRQKIDDTDLRILELLNRRAGFALEIGKIKRGMNMPIYCPDREKDVIRNVVSNNRGPLSEKAIVRLYERIIDESRRLEREEAVKYYQTENGNEEKS